MKSIKSFWRWFSLAKEWTECFSEFAIENTVNDDVHRTDDNINGKDLAVECRYCLSKFVTVVQLFRM